MTLQRLRVPIGGVLLCAALAWAQPVTPPDPRVQQAQQQKAAQYLRIEYERCRSDLLEIWVKGDAVEQRAKDLEEEVRKLTEELNLLRGSGGEKPQN